MLRLPTAALLLITSGCLVGLDLPDGAQLSCSADDDCPEGFVCNPTSQRCVDVSSKDFDAPIFTEDPLLAPAIINGTGSATLTLAFNEPLGAKPRAWFVRNGAPVAFTALDAPSSLTQRLRYNAGVDDDEGIYAVQAHAEDELGNPADFQLDVTLTIDTTDPAVVPLSLRLRPEAGDGNVIGEKVGGIPEALGADGSAEVTFVSTEPLDGLPDVSLTGVAETFADSVVVTGDLVTATFSFGTASVGTYTGLRIGITDLAQNSATYDFTLGTEVTGPSSLVVDRSAPAVAAVNTSRLIVFSRAPWGEQATGHVPHFAITGGVSAVEALAYVFAYEDANDDPLDAVGGVRAGPDGSFSAMELGVGERNQAFIRVIDAAGNVGPLARVRDVDWFATTKHPTAAPQNPHAFFAQPRAAGVATDTDVNLAGDGALGEIDADVVSTVGAGGWRARREDAEPDWRYRAQGVLDLGTNELYIMGGTVQGSNVTTCDGGTTSPCPGIFRREGLAWKSVPNVAAPGEDLPSLGTDFSIVYDVARRAVMGYQGNTQRLWSWENETWTIVAASGAADLGPSRFNGQMLVYDAVRARLLLFGGQGPTAECGSTSYCNTMWAWDGSWSPVVTATRPPARVNGSLVYDPVRGVVVLIGGFADVGAGAGLACGDGSTSWVSGRCYYNDIWEYDGVDWAKRCDGVPGTDTCSRVPFRAELMGAVYDAAHEQVLVFGGRSIPGTSLASCEDTTAKDAGGQCVYVATWGWNGTDLQRWNPPLSAGFDDDPLARHSSTLGYDMKRGRALLFGGIRGGSVAPDSSRQVTYEWQGDHWRAERNPYPNNEPPLLRTDFAMTNVGDDGIFLFGGADYGNEDCGGQGTIDCNDGHFWGPGLDPTPGWTVSDCDIGAQCPGSVSRTRAAYDWSLGRVILVGGASETTFCDEGGDDYCMVTWRIDTDFESSNWTRQAVTALSRANHAMASAGRTLKTAAPANTCDGRGPWVFGGEVGADRNDLVKYVAGAWNTHSANCDVDVDPPTGCPGNPRSRSSAEITCDEQRDELVLFGGVVQSGDCGNGIAYCGDTWTFDAGVWTAEAVSDPEGDGNPAPRAGHRMVWDTTRNAVLLHGGEAYIATASGDCGDGSLANGGYCVYGDTWEWTGSSWARVNTVALTDEGSPGRRSSHGLAHLADRGETLLFAGRASGTPAYNTWYWQSGSDGRPRHVFQVSLAAAQSLNATVTDLEIDWTAGAVADDGACDALYGAELLVLRSGSWKRVASGSEDTGSPETISWRYATDPDWVINGATAASLFLRGSGLELAFAVQPRGDSGCASRRAQVTTDYAQVRIAYRMASLVVP